MKGLTKYWFIENVNIFKKLDITTMKGKCEILEKENLNKGTQIPLINRNKKSIFFFKRGIVKMVNTSNDILKHLVKRGNFFGELALYDDEAGKEEIAYALKYFIFYHIEAGQMDELLEKQKFLKNGILKIYGLSIKKLERRLHVLRYKERPARIMDIIIDYLKEYRNIDKVGNIVVKNLLFHKEIANLKNTLRQTVSHVLSSMRNEGLLFFDAQAISLQCSHVINRKTKPLINP